MKCVWNVACQSLQRKRIFIEKIYLNITKGGLLSEFERQSKIRIRRESDDEFERYCREVEAIIRGDYGTAEEREGEQCELEKGKAEVAGTDSEVGGREEEAP